MLVTLRMLLVRKGLACVIVKGPPWPAGRVLTCIRVGWSTVCESEKVFIMSMNVSCNWRLFV